jgi:peptidyl-prolyl cis-trans isomerase SurA
MKGIIEMKAVLGMIFSIVVFTLLVGGCSPKASDIVVMEVGQTKVSLAEYENFYTRNTGGWETARNSTLEERAHFLDLLTNYKLKLQDAVDRNLINDTDVVREIKEYRASLASTFMVDKEITEHGIQELYDHKKEEIRAQHILIKLAPTASPEETLKAYTKAIDIIRRAKAGEIFDSLAIKNSDDPSVKINYGDIYYFTGGQMVGPFEDAAFAMKKGEISSSPARSAFGYHIIKITDRQKVRGTIKVSHIMTRFRTSASDSADTTASLNRMKSIQDSLKHGGDFHKLAMKLSEDAGSAPQGGDLGWFERRRFVQPFDEAAFKLKTGEISDIIRTPYGYHLILCDSTKPFPSISDPKYRDELKKVYSQHKYNEDYSTYIGQLKKNYNYSFDEKTFDEFISHLDTTKTNYDSAWSSSVPPEICQKPMMTMTGRNILVDTIITLFESRPEYQNTPLRSAELRKRIDQMSNTFLLDMKSFGLEQRYPEFASLMKEYTDGIILYKAEQLEVWGKTSVSDSALKEYYSQNQSKFIFPDRVNMMVLVFDTDTLAALVYDSLQHGADFGEMLSRYKEVPAPKTKDGSRGLQPVKTDTLTQRAWTLADGHISDPIQTEDGTFAIVKLIAKESTRQKTFEEAGAEISNAYQDYTSKLLEQQWLDRIKLMHPVIQYKEVLPKAFASPPSAK